MASKEQRIVSFIQEHGILAEVVDGEIWAEERTTFQGKLYTENVKLPSNWADVRNWLGY